MKKLLYTLFALIAIVACSESDVDNGGGQETPKQPEITLSTAAADFSTDGGSNVITFTSSEAWTAQVVNSRADEWCSIEPTSGPAGSAKITVTTTENNTPDDRTASIIIKAGTASKTINVSQKQKDALTVTSSKFEVSAEGGEVSIEVKANIDFEYAIEESAADWVEYKATRALKTSNLVFEVKENDDTDKREAKITITSGEFSEVVTIYQAGFEPIIILSNHEKYVSYEANTISVDVKSNVDVTITIPSDVDWIRESSTRIYSTNTYYFEIDQNDGYAVRTAEIEFTNKENDISEILTISQMADEAKVLAAEREALIAFYEATGGDNWTRNDNWCSDKPVSEWYGVYTNDNGTIKDISLTGNNLNGVIPPEIGNLANLELLIITGVFSGALPSEIGNLSKLGHLHVEGLIGNIPNEIGELHDLELLNLDNCNFDGGIPTTIGKLQNLKELHICHSNLSGEIPKELGNLSKLEWLALTFNQLTGGIPKELSSLQNLNNIDIRVNRLAGRIPSEILEWPMFQEQWGFIIPQQDGYGFSLDGVEFYAPQFSMSSLSGKTVSNSIFAENDYTVLYHFNDGCAFSSQFTPKLIELYEGYKNRGLGVFSATWQRSNIVQAYANSHNIPWEILIEPENLSWDKGTFANYYVQTPFVAVFDTTGRVVFNSALRDYCELPVFLNEALGAPDDVIHNYYESTDYSKDGVVKTLQTATKGDGIDIVLMGDAYSDRLVADGTYDNAMNTAMEKFFAVEPYKSFRDHFNVYSVTAVSQNEVYSDAASTVFEGYFGEGTHVGGNGEKVFDYATKAISADLIDEALIVVMMNSPVYAGTCYMYGPSEGDWGDGASVSYFPVGVNDEALAQILHHEAGGHGFAKLGDEYAYQENGTISGSEIADAQNMATYGWWKNVDFTNDPTAVKWSHFLSDARYASDGLGVYEGAFTYWTGAYRPTYNSIMNTNVGGFNAPSREAIYYRIHKLAYGSSWQYNYEEFVEWDAKNRVTSSAAYGIPYRLNVPENFKPLHPPVVVNKSWREVMEEK